MAESCTNRQVVVFVTPQSRAEFSELERDGFTLIDIFQFTRLLNVDFGVGAVCLEGPTALIDSLTSADAVIFHPDSWELLEHRPVAGDSSLQFAKRQILAVLHFLEDWLNRSKSLVTDTRVSRRYSNKLIQLSHLAAAFPQVVPNATRVVDDVSSIPIGHLVKHVSESRDITDELSNFAQILDAEAVGMLAADEQLPLISQLPLKSDREFRTFLFGEHAVTICFRRDVLPSSMIDIHTDAAVLLSPEAVNIDGEHLAQLQRIRISMQLGYRFFFDG